MKRNIGSKNVLYPTPAVVVGAMNGDVPTWTLVAHIGIPAHDRVMVSLAKPHFINHLVREAGTFSINLVDEAWLAKADHCGCVSGASESKADVFAWTAGDAGAPIIDEARLSMECSVEDVWECGAFENFVASVANTYAEESILNEKGKVGFGTLYKPVLFEMPNYTYLSLGNVVARCKHVGE